MASIWRRSKSWMMVRDAMGFPLGREHAFGRPEVARPQQAALAEIRQAF
jgi:hypothetical protein